MRPLSTSLPENYDARNLLRGRPFGWRCSWQLLKKSAGVSNVHDWLILGLILTLMAAYVGAMVLIGSLLAWFLAAFMAACGLNLAAIWTTRTVRGDLKQLIEAANQEFWGRMLADPNFRRWLWNAQDKEAGSCAQHLSIYGLTSDSEPAAILAHATTSELARLELHYANWRSRPLNERRYCRV